MTMKQIKVSEATDAVLDWLVAKCLGGSILTEHGLFLDQGDGYEYFTPSSSWEQGGLIIDWQMKLYGFDLWSVDHTKDQYAATYTRGVPDTYVFGPTPLIAAMRCYVMNRFGEFAEVPEELL